MRFLCVIILTATILVPNPVQTQTRNYKPLSLNEQLVASDAEKAWPAFFATFRAAVRKRNRAALKRMLADGLLFSLGGGGGPDEAFKFWVRDNGRGWVAFERTLNGGVAHLARWWNNGRDPERPSRVAPAAANLRANIERGRISWYAIFRFNEDGRWYCEIFQECCD
jgi:hypothetical protein